jgi:hypothetical protein
MEDEIGSNIIWHFDVPISECVNLTLPHGAVIFDLALYENSIRLYVSCDEDAPPQDRELFVLSDGTYIPSHHVGYLGTVSLLDGNLVYHVFENLAMEDTSEQKEDEVST